MRVIKHRIPYDLHSRHRIVFFGDIHYGAAGCNVDLLKRFVKMYADDDDARFILMGDEVEGITRGDRRFDIMSVAERYRHTRNPIDMMVDDLCEILYPLKGRIVAGVDSNHVKTYRDDAESCPHYRLSKHLEFERLGYGGWVAFLFDYQGKIGNRVRSVVVHATHGKGAGSTIGGTLNTLEADSTWLPDADVVAHGHTHRLSAGLSRVMLHLNSTMTGYQARKQHLIQTGSFLRSYSRDEFSPYSEVKRYKPINLGWAVAEVSWDTTAKAPMRIKTWAEDYQ